MRRIAISLTVLIFLLTNSTTQAEETASTTNPFTITSSATSNQGILPVLYTCDGKDISPKITWAGTPEKTASFALVFSDLDAPGGIFYHWVLYNIPKDTTELAEGVDALPRGTIVMKNSWEKSQYNGPCPPKGASHHYVFTLFALDTKLNLEAGADSEALYTAMKEHVLDKTEFAVVYSRWLS